MKTDFIQRNPVLTGKFWYALLFNWKQLGHSGLTLTYLIGSQDFLPSGMGRLSIVELVEDIASNDNCKVILTYCMDLNDLILGIMAAGRKDFPGRFVLDGKGGDTALFVNHYVDDLGETISEVSASMKGRYQRYIDEKLYSMNNRERGYFTHLEIQFIQSSFSYLQRQSS